MQKIFLQSKFQAMQCTVDLIIRVKQYCSSTHSLHFSLGLSNDSKLTYIDYKTALNCWHINPLSIIQYLQINQYLTNLDDYCKMRKISNVCTSSKNEPRNWPQNWKRPEIDNVFNHLQTS